MARGPSQLADHLTELAQNLRRDGSARTCSQVAHALRELALELDPSALGPSAGGAVTAAPSPPSEGAPHQRASVRSDRVVEVGDGRSLPVRIAIAEPIELVAVHARRDDDCARLHLELHNPSEDVYAVTGKVLLTDHAGATIGHCDFAVGEVAPLATVTRDEQVELGTQVCGVSIVASTRIAGAGATTG